MASVDGITAKTPGHTNMPLFTSEKEKKRNLAKNHISAAHKDRQQENRENQEGKETKERGYETGTQGE